MQSEPPKPEPELWEATIHYDLVSPNKLMRMHYRARMKEFDRVRDMIWYYGRPFVTFNGPVDVQITRLWGTRQRAMDLDNLYGACKPLIDALKKPKGRFRTGLERI